MSDDSQLRKDVDKLLKFAEDISNDLDNKSIREYLATILDVDELDNYTNKITTLSNDLYSLRVSLVEVNKELIDFSSDNTNFANNLRKLKENIAKVLSEMKEIKEGSSEFSDALAQFNIDITTFVDTLMGLNGDLSIFSECLDAFMDNLDGFEDALEDAGIDTTEINEDYAKLVWAVANVRTRTDTTEGQIENIVNNDIGDDTNYNPSLYNPPNTANAPQGVKQWIKWMKYKIGNNASGQETGFFKSILDLELLIGDDDPVNPTGIFADIQTANGHISTIGEYIYGVGGSENDLKSDGLLSKIDVLRNNTIPQIITYIYGKANGSSSDYTSDSMWAKIVALKSETSNLNLNMCSILAPNSNLTYVYVYAHTGSPTSDDATFLTTLATDYGINNVQYACEKDGANYYKLVNGSWTTYNQSLSNVVAIFGAESNGSSAISERNKNYWEKDWEYAYDLVTNQYYKHYNRYSTGGV